MLQRWHRHLQQLFGTTRKGDDHEHDLNVEHALGSSIRIGISPLPANLSRKR
jgi:hypothetical protein